MNEQFGSNGINGWIVPITFIKRSNQSRKGNRYFEGQNGALSKGKPAA